MKIHFWHMGRCPEKSGSGFYPPFLLTSFHVLFMPLAEAEGIIMDRITAAVAVVNGRATTTSLKIAEVFGKRHADVIRAIKSIETPDNFNERNFALVEYTDAKGEKRPAYQIARDGFTLLAMGFTGEKAMQFKIAYIEAFNAMEEQLRQHPGTARPLPEPPALFRHEYRGARVATTAELAEYWSVPPMRLHTALSKNSARFTDGVDIFRASSLFGDKSALTQTRNGQFQYSNLYTPSGAAKMAQLIGKHLAGLPALPAPMVKRGAFVPVVRLPDALDQRGAEYDDFVTASLFEVIAGMDARTRRAWFDQLRERGQIEPATVNKPELIERLHRSRSHAKGIFSRVIGAVARCLDISGIDPGRIRLRGDFARLNFQRAAVAGNMIGEE